MDQPDALVVGGNRQPWKWSDRPDDVGVVSGVEAWVFALRGSYLWGGALCAKHLENHRLIILNLNPEHLDRYDRLLRAVRERGKVVGLCEGGLAELAANWRMWSRVADQCDLVIAINAHGLSYLRSLTSTSVEHIGIPYPVDGVRLYATPIEARRSEILLCAPLLARPLDYLAARELGVRMIGYERTFPLRIRDVTRHRTLDRNTYVRRAQELYNDPMLDVLAQTTPQRYLERGARARIWMNIDPRYTWGRNVLDGAALGVPVVSTRETWHARFLFPDLVVDSPYDIAGATAIARMLLENDRFYGDVVERAGAGIEEYRADACVQKLDSIVEWRG